LPYHDNVISSAAHAGGNFGHHFLKCAITKSFNGWIPAVKTVLAVTVAFPGGVYAYTSAFFHLCFLPGFKYPGVMLLFCICGAFN
jgi:hypothetical protein